MSLFNELENRGFIKQATHLEEIKKLVNDEKVVFYIGYDPTADSLTVGHFVTLMFMSHMQKYGHKPIVLVGGGTVMVGDPTGKVDMRKMLSVDTISDNLHKIKNQMKKFIDFSDNKAIMINNADWILKLNYIDFLREIGTKFSVNNMLRAECFKQRLEKGLSFIEFNYMIMQAYDFLYLNEKYNCIMQLGGDDQWSNMIAGMDLIKKKTGKQVYALTCNLLLTSDGKKMGKTESGAVWLDKEKTSVYDFYQYWRNIGDGDVERTLKMLTFLPLDEIEDLCKVESAEINKAKEVLAFEVTK
ncbi:Tyrosyl-tRNA synthetase, partial [Candidatus Arthromitus sp. SFB-5]